MSDWEIVAEVVKTIGAAAKGPTEQESDEILRAMPGGLIRGDIDGFRLRRAIMDAFNAIEPIAMAYHYGLVDLEVIDKSVSTVVLRRYAFFRDFLHATKRLRGDDPWPLIPSLVARLKRERERRGEAALD